MKTACGPRVILLLSVAVLAASGNGCAVGFKGFSMDSISKMPYFGFELKERKKTSNAPVYNSISQNELETARIEPAVRTDTTASRNFMNLGIKNPFSSKANGSAAGETQRIDPPQTSITIPVTVTPGAKSSIDRVASTSAIDFQ